MGLRSQESESSALAFMSSASYLPLLWHFLLPASQVALQVQPRLFLWSPGLCYMEDIPLSLGLLAIAILRTERPSFLLRIV